MNNFFLYEIPVVDMIKKQKIKYILTIVYCEKKHQYFDYDDVVVY